MQDCHSAVAEEIQLLECDAYDSVSLDKWLLTCQRIIVHSSSWSKWSKNCLTLKTKAPRTFETSATTDLVTQRHILAHWHSVTCVTSWHTDTMSRVTSWHTDTAPHVSHPSTLTQRHMCHILAHWHSATCVTSWHTDTASHVSHPGTLTLRHVSHPGTLTQRHVSSWHTDTAPRVTSWHTDTVPHVSHPGTLESSATALWRPHISRFAWCECGIICVSIVVWTSYVWDGCASVCPQVRLRCPCCLSCLLAFLANPCPSCLLAALPNLLTSTCLPAPTKEVSQIWQHCSHTVICHNSQQMHEVTMLHRGFDCLSICVSCTKST